MPDDQPVEQAGDLTGSGAKAEEIHPADDDAPRVPGGEGVAERAGEAAAQPVESPDEAPVAGASGPLESADEVVPVGVGHASPVVEESVEAGDSGPDPESGAAAGSPGPLRRLTRLGVTLILVASLVYVARDAIPPAWTDRFVELTGLREYVSRFFPSRAEISGGPEEPAPLPEATGEHAALYAAPADEISDEEAGGKPLPGEPPVAEPELPTASAPTWATGENVAEHAAPVAEFGQEEAGAGTATGEPAVAEPDLPLASAPNFFINFSADSDLLESDAWNALDRAALLLREQSGRIGLITESTGGPEAEHLDSKLTEARVAAVEQYLIAAGVDRQRLRVNGRTLTESMQGQAAAEAGAMGTDDRIVRITIGSRPPP